MPATATMIGALLGLSTQIYSNALRKLPLMRRKNPPFFPLNLYIFIISINYISINSFLDLILKIRQLGCSDPWEHVLGMGLGVVAINQLVKWEVKLDQDLDKLLEKSKAANERRYFGISFFGFSKDLILMVFSLFLTCECMCCVWY